MSALTKVFVLLLVILSIIQTAGTVVFVNRENHYALTLRNQKSDNQAAKAAQAQAEADRDALQQRNTALTAEMNNLRNSSNQRIEQLTGQVAEKDAAIAQATAQATLAMSSQKSATDALGIAQKSIDAQSAQIAELRKSSLDSAKVASDLQVANADLTNRFETIKTQWRDEREQNAQLQGQVRSANEIIHRSGIDANSPVINREAMVRVEGVVRSRNDLDGVPMATISIGSADQIAKGMRLAVIDPNARDPFLGYIDIENTDKNQAVGRLSGPHISQIRQGSVVRTQL